MQAIQDWVGRLTDAPPHDPEAWLKEFESKRRSAALLRRKVVDGTLRAIKRGYYECGEERVELPTKAMEEGVRGASLFPPSAARGQRGARAPPGAASSLAAGDAAASAPAALPAQRRPPQEGPIGGTFGTMAVEISQEDSFAAALRFTDGRRHVAVLNFANQYEPGGGWRYGAGAQEENLHRRSNLSDHLANPRGLPRPRSIRYPLPEFGGVFSRDVCVFRGPESEGYPFLKAPVMLSVITSAAYDGPELDRSGQKMLSRYAEGTRRKVDEILNVACQEAVEVLILGAFGCGAFRNPPRQVARIFRELLATKYQSRFQHVVFAIVDRADRPDENCGVFREVFAESTRPNVVGV